MKRKISLIAYAFSMVFFFAFTVNADPVITDFSISPNTITPGDSATLSWSVTGADSVTINNGIGTVASSGSLSITPSATTTYEITANCSTCTQLVIFSGGTSTTTGLSVSESSAVTVQAAAVTPVISIAPVIPITVSAPTMNEWGMIILITFIGLISVYRIRRMKQS